MAGLGKNGHWWRGRRQNKLSFHNQGGRLLAGIHSHTFWMSATWSRELINNDVFIIGKLFTFDERDSRGNWMLSRCSLLSSPLLSDRGMVKSCCPLARAANCLCKGKHGHQERAAVCLLAATSKKRLGHIESDSKSSKHDCLVLRRVGLVRSLREPTTLL